MLDKPCFIDTNIWLYAFIEADSSHKSNIARHLIQQVQPIVSSQVINEVCVNLLKKTVFPEHKIKQLIISFYDKYQVIETNKEILILASQLREQYSISYWDSTILAGALYSGVNTLYSEDMQNGLFVQNQLHIQNPFI